MAEESQNGSCHLKYFGKEIQGDSNTLNNKFFDGFHDIKCLYCLNGWLPQPKLNRILQIAITIRLRANPSLIPQTCKYCGGKNLHLLNIDFRAKCFHAKALVLQAEYDNEENAEYDKED